MTTRKFPDVIVTNQLPNHMRNLRRSVRKCARVVPNPQLYLTGKALEPVVADAFSGYATGDNSFIDVVANGTGWQLKSTIQTTKHIVLRRAKVEDKLTRVLASKTSAAVRRGIGDELLNSSNELLQAAREKHGVDRLGFVHLKFFEDNEVEVTEALFAETRLPFNPDSFYWEWSDAFYGQMPRTGLPSLLGVRRGTDEPWFSWNGQNENHFTLLKEREWLADRCDTVNRYGFTTMPSSSYMSMDTFVHTTEEKHSVVVVGG